jgi:hypothetical protein
MPKVSLVMIVALALLLIGGSSGRAAGQTVDPERMALAKSYLDVSLQVVTTKQLGDIVAQGLIQLNPDLKDDITGVVPGVLPRFDPYLATMMDDVARVYATRFTAPELKEIIAFYKTPTGQKLAQESPAASAEAYQISARWGARIGEDMSNAIAKELAVQGKTVKLPARRQ